MGLRPARCYRTFERPNTRQSIRKPKKGYVKGVPELKIHKFEMGNRTKAFPRKVSLLALKDAQVRDNALEAARNAAHKILARDLGEEGFFLKIVVYPFHVLRENPLATGAGADRYQSGMRQSFGKPIGSAAQVRKLQPILHVWLEAGKAQVAKDALRIAGYKLPVTTRIIEGAA
ncbi:MAG: 50S ribosomal protein L16 [Candidatus Aenigmarchaeota archaeon]|nr:50S ribosomal protein L16 [Candidatus Aenigmarchaeota archaeon]